MNLTAIFHAEAAQEEGVHQEFGERIFMLLKQQKRSKSWLAEQIGISKQALNYLLKRSAKPKFLNEIATALDVNPEWLKTGKGVFINLTGGNPYVRKIPLLPMEIIGQSDNTQLMELITADQSYPSSCFAVKLENTSMEPTFIQGSILIFDPGKKPRSGDFIVFSVEMTKEVFFRQYFSDGGDIYLKATDVMYKNFKNENIIVHGVLIESRNKFK